MVREAGLVGRERSACASPRHCLELAVHKSLVPIAEDTTFQGIDEARKIYLYTEQGFDAFLWKIHSYTQG